MRRWEKDHRGGRRGCGKREKRFFSSFLCLASSCMALHGTTQPRVSRRSRVPQTMFPEWRAHRTRHALEPPRPPSYLFPPYALPIDGRLPLLVTPAGSLTIPSCRQERYLELCIYNCFFHLKLNRQREKVLKALKNICMLCNCKSRESVYLK